MRDHGGGFERKLGPVTKTAARYTAYMLACARNPHRYHFATPWHNNYLVHEKFAGPKFPHLRDYLKLVRNPLDPSVSDSRIPHAKTLEGSIGGFVKRAANWRGAYSAFPSVHGCTGANQMGLAAALDHGDKVVFTAGQHRSIEDVVLLRCRHGFKLDVAYIPTRWSSLTETFLPPATSDVRKTLARHKDARLVVLTAPTYPGIYPLDLEETVRAIRALASQALILVDCAWGTHFGASDLLPSFPTRFGVDFVSSSDHKSGIAEEQTAMLYVSEAVADAVGEAYRAQISTSPDHRMLASLEVSLLTLMENGEEILADAVTFAERLRAELALVEGVRVVGHRELELDPERYFLDPLKVIIDVSQTGLSGHEICRFLQEQEQVVPEMSTSRCVLFLVNPAYEADDAIDVAERVAGVIERNLPGRVARAPLTPPVVEMVKSPWEALNARTERVDLQDSIGRIGATCVGVYPPGIYVIRPGQLIAAATIEYLESALASQDDDGGAKVQGLSGRSIEVLSELLIRGHGHIHEASVVAARPREMM